MNKEVNKKNMNQDSKAFPAHPTVLVGVWLLLFSCLSVYGLYVLFLPETLSGLFDSLGDKNLGEEIKQSLITMVSAGIGSSVTTIMGYLLHASEQKDFDNAYVPWYFARPVMGMLLGLIFYFVLKAGFFVLTIGDSGTKIGQLNLWSLSAIGALVGLFSKNAIEKLREIFNTLFRTKDDMNQNLLERLPTELKEKISPYL